MKELPPELRVFEQGREGPSRLSLASPNPPIFASADDLKAKEAAYRMNVHVNTLKKMLRSGMVMGAYRIGTRGDWRIPVKSLELFKERGGSR